MIRKGLAVCVILLFIGVGVAPGINANVNKSILNTKVIEKTDDATYIEFKIQRIRELIENIDLPKTIVNTEILIGKLDEISLIIDENRDIINNIEKSSDEDCNCEKTKEWGYPIICISLKIMMGFMFIFWFILLRLFMIPPSAVLDLLEFLLTPFTLLYQHFNCPE